MSAREKSCVAPEFLILTSGFSGVKIAGGTLCTFFTFLSDRLVYMILRGHIDPKQQCKKFFFKIMSS